MTTTTIRAALAHVRALPWGNYRIRAIAGLRLCWVVAQLLGMVIAIAWQLAYEHRAQIRHAVAVAITSIWLAAHVTYRAGCWTRRQLEALSGRSAALVAQQPLPAVAPITASLAAAREALERLVRRLYPAVA